jgi:hypothetical protein
MVGVCAATVLGGGQVAAHAAAYPPGCYPGTNSTESDLDGDGDADVVVGMPGKDKALGAVDVRYTSTRAQVLDAHAVGGGGAKNTRFGAAIVMADLDVDGCADLVIGAPGEARTDSPGIGQVHIFFGGPGGLKLSDTITLPHSLAGDDFGAALAVVTRYVGQTEVHDLYVGAPDAKVGGKSRAGQVSRFTLTPNRAKRLVATLREVRHQDSAGVPGASEQGDRFGSVLAATQNGVLVGAPSEDVGSKRDAGAMWFLRVNNAGAPIASQSWTQDSPGVPGTAERGDHFGAVIGGGDWAMVGVPDEDDGKKVDSGVVQVFHQDFDTSAYSPGEVISQDSANIPGTSQAGDRFGAAVNVVQGLQSMEQIDMAIGSPGEDVGKRKNAGTITLIPITDHGSGAKIVRQGSGLAGAAEAGDEVGSVFGITQAPVGWEEGEQPNFRILIGVPREDVGTHADAGLVESMGGYSILANGVRTSSLTYSQGHLNTNHYGMVLSTRAY